MILMSYPSNRLTTTRVSHGRVIRLMDRQGGSVSFVNLPFLVPANYLVLIRGCIKIWKIPKRSDVSSALLYTRTFFVFLKLSDKISRVLKVHSTTGSFEEQQRIEKVRVSLPCLF